MQPMTPTEFALCTECEAWSQRIDAALESVAENLHGFDGGGGEYARQGLMLIERALRVGAATLNALNGSGTVSAGRA